MNSGVPGNEPAGSVLHHSPCPHSRPSASSFRHRLVAGASGLLMHLSSMFPFLLKQQHMKDFFGGEYVLCCKHILANKISLQDVDERLDPAHPIEVEDHPIQRPTRRRRLNDDIVFVMQVCSALSDMLMFAQCFCDASSHAAVGFMCAGFHEVNLAKLFIHVCPPSPASRSTSSFLRLAIARLYGSTCFRRLHAVTRMSVVNSQVHVLGHRCASFV